MVADGVTDVLVPVTAPIPWSIESEVAPSTAQERVELPPGAIDAGEAAKLLITGTGPLVTLTVAEATLPDAVWVAVTTAPPRPTALTSPALLTVATARLADTKVELPVRLTVVESL